MVAEMWISQVKRACQSAMIVEALYFTGDFRTEESVLENSDPISFIPQHARRDYLAPTLHGLDRQSEPPTPVAVDNSEAVVHGIACEQKDSAIEAKKINGRTFLLSMVTDFITEQFCRWRWQPLPEPPQFTSHGTVVDNYLGSSSSGWSVRTPQLFLSSLSRTSSSKGSDLSCV
jgi:hypothetical protein